MKERLTEDNQTMINTKERTGHENTARLPHCQSQEILVMFVSGTTFIPTSHKNVRPRSVTLESIIV